MATSLSQTAQASGPVVGGNAPGGEAISDARVLTSDEQKAIMKPTEKPAVAPERVALARATAAGEELPEGEFRGGTTGFVELDDEGTPTGAAQHAIDPTIPQAPVVLVGPVTPDDVTTPAGAPLTNHMNPMPSGLDPGFLERNPPGGTPKWPGTEEQQWEAIRSAQGENAPATATAQAKAGSTAPAPKTSSTTSSTPST